MLTKKYCKAGVNECKLLETSFVKVCFIKTELEMWLTHPVTLGLHPLWVKPLASSSPHDSAKDFCLSSFEYTYVITIKGNFD